MPKYINDEYQNFMTNMECRITNQNQRMNIENIDIMNELSHQDTRRYN